MRIILTEDQIDKINESVERLAFFDHDGTLVNVPDEEEGKEKWRQVTGTEYPHKGWWSKPESLDMEVFEIVPNPSVVKDYKERYDDPKTLCFLLTNRIPALEQQIKTVLNSHGIVMDDYFFRDNHRDKAQIVKDEAQKYPNLQLIEVWDDREKELSKLRQLKNEFEDTQLNIYAVTN